MLSMRSKLVIGILLLHQIIIIQAVSIPPQSAVIGDNHAILLQNISAKIDAPAPPPGFDLDLEYNPLIHLSPLGVYLSAIDGMYTFALKGWDEEFRGGYRVWARDYKVEVDIESAHASFPLQTKHIISGLLDVLVTMSTDKIFCKVVATLFVHRRQIGYVTVQDSFSGPLQNGTSSDEITNDPLTSSNTTNLVNATSGRVSDPDEPRFTIAYTYTGARLNSQDVFLAILDAYATGAEHDADSAFESLTATSATGKCEVKFSQVTGPEQMDYSLFFKALRILVWDVIVDLKRFWEMTLELDWEGVRMAEGSIRAATPSEGDTARIEVSR